MQLCKRTTGLEHSRVLGYLCDDMITTCAVCQGNSVHSQIITLRTATGEDDFSRGTSQQLGDLSSRSVYGLVGSLSVAMCARWVAKVMREIRQHGLDDGRVHRCGGIVIEVDRAILQAGMCDHLFPPVTFF